jgi:hypothetical protein
MVVSTEPEADEDPNQRLYLLVAGIIGSILLILMLPYLMAWFGRAKNSKKSTSLHNLEKPAVTATVTQAPSLPPAAPSNKSNDITRFAGSTQARKPKDQEDTYPPSS